MNIKKSVLASAFALMSTMSLADNTVFFAFDCPECFKLENAETDGIEFTLVPAVWDDEYEMHARAFYAIEALGLDESKIDILYEASMSGYDISKPYVIARLLADGFRSEAVIKTTLFSEYVSDKVELAKSQLAEYELKGTPALLLGSAEDEIYGSANKLIRKMEKALAKEMEESK